jgi:hypothetical protein
MRVAVTLLAFLASLGAASAQQLEFRSAIRTGDIRFSYRWLDHGGREFNAAFMLTRDAVREAEASFRDFDSEAMARFVEAEMRGEIDRSAGGARVTLRRTPTGLAWSIEGRDQASIDALGHRLHERLKASQAAYLARHLRRQVDERRFMIDFAAATRVQQGPLRTVAQALGEARGIANTDRARIAHALAFFQVIPYDPLQPTARQGGDFLSAPALLAQNRGDCDSKSAALAAVLRSYVPSRKLAVVTMPDHAILAVDLAPAPGDRTIRTSGRTLVALEAAGPALVPVGQVGPDTERRLSARGVEVWPLD